MDEPRALQTTEEKIEQALSHWRRVVPAVFTAVLILTTAAPIFVTGPIWPHIAVLSVYCWVLRAPALMPVWLAFLLGLLADVWMAMPFGLNAVLLAWMTALIASQHQVFASRPFGFAWGACLPVLLIYQLCSYLLTRAFGFDVTPEPFIMQALSSFLLYPLIGLLASWAQRLFLDRRLSRLAHRD